MPFPEEVRASGVLVAATIALTQPGQDQARWPVPLRLGPGDGERLRRTAETLLGAGAGHAPSSSSSASAAAAAGGGGADAVRRRQLCSAMAASLQALRATGLVVGAATGLPVSRAGAALEAARQRGSALVAPPGLWFLALPSFGRDVDAAADVLAAGGVVEAGSDHPGGPAGLRRRVWSSGEQYGAGAAPLAGGKPQALHVAARAVVTADHLLRGGAAGWWRVPAGRQAVPAAARKAAAEHPDSPLEPLERVLPREDAPGGRRGREKSAGRRAREAADAETPSLRAWAAALSAGSGGGWDPARAPRVVPPAAPVSAPSSEEPAANAAAWGRAAAAVRGRAGEPSRGGGGDPARWRCLPLRWSPQVLLRGGGVLGRAVASPGDARRALASVLRLPLPPHASGLPRIDAAALRRARMGLRALGGPPSLAAAAEAAARACVGRPAATKRRRDGRSGPGAGAQPWQGESPPEVAAATAAALVLLAASDGAVDALPPAPGAAGRSGGPGVGQGAGASALDGLDVDDLLVREGAEAAPPGSARPADEGADPAAAPALGADPATVPLSDAQVDAVFAAVASAFASLSGASLRLTLVGAAVAASSRLPGEDLGWACGLCLGPLLEPG